MNRYVTVGLTVLAGAALLEAALIPGMVLGGAAVLAPKLLPSLRRRLAPMFASTAPARADRPTKLPDRYSHKPVTIWGQIKVGRSVAKTITFRIIVTALDFTSNIVVIGELTTAAGLSAISLAAAPFFYFMHETFWNYFGPTGTHVPLRLPRANEAEEASSDENTPTINRAVAKTITFRTFATVMDFTTTYLVVGDLTTAAVLTAFGFIVGPFVYLGHEMAWDYLDPLKQDDDDAPETRGSNVVPIRSPNLALSPI